MEIRFSAVGPADPERAVRTAAALSVQHLRQAAHSAAYGNALTPLLRDAHAQGEALLAAVDVLIAADGFPLRASGELLAATLRSAAADAEGLVDRVSPTGHATGARASDVDVLLRRAAERLVPERQKLGVRTRSAAAEELAHRVALLPAHSAVVVAEGSSGTVLVCAQMRDSNGRARGTYKLALRVPGTPVTYVDRGPLHGELGFEHLKAADGVTLTEKASALARAIPKGDAPWMLAEAAEIAGLQDLALVELRAPVL